MPIHYDNIEDGQDKNVTSYSRSLLQLCYVYPSIIKLWIGRTNEISCEHAKPRPLREEVGAPVSDQQFVL